MTTSTSRNGGPDVTGFFDPRTSSIQYVAADPVTRHCVLIDPILDYDETSGATATLMADRLLRHVREHGPDVRWILDTHPHADHLSAAHHLHERTGAPTAIGERVVAMQEMWRKIYNLPTTFPTDGSQWDHRFADGERFALGQIPCSVLLSPGHTLASVTYLVGDAAFIHDTLFMPDAGTARTDFPGGDAQRLWRSIQAILALPGETRVFTGHDYQPGGREPRWESTVDEQRRENIHLARAGDEASFVALRRARDATLPMPRLMLHALQVNVAGGRLPEPEADGRRYLKIPLDAMGATIGE